MIDKEALKLVPVIEDEKLTLMLLEHAEKMGLDYCDDPKIIRYAFKVSTAHNEAAYEVDRIIDRVRREK